MVCTHSLEMEGDNNKNIRNIADNKMSGGIVKPNKTILRERNILNPRL